MISKCDSNNIKVGKEYGHDIFLNTIDRKFWCKLEGRDKVRGASYAYVKGRISKHINSYHNLRDLIGNRIDEVFYYDKSIGHSSWKMIAVKLTGKTRKRGRSGYFYQIKEVDSAKTSWVLAYQLYLIDSKTAEKCNKMNNDYRNLSDTIDSYYSNYIECNTLENIMARGHKK